jgi:hypothetical protein
MGDAGCVDGGEIGDQVAVLARGEESYRSCARHFEQVIRMSWEYLEQKLRSNGRGSCE